MLWEGKSALVGGGHRARKPILPRTRSACVRECNRLIIRTAFPINFCLKIMIKTIKKSGKMFFTENNQTLNEYNEYNVITFALLGNYHLIRDDNVLK